MEGGMAEGGGEADGGWGDGWGEGVRQWALGRAWRKFDGREEWDLLRLLLLDLELLLKESLVEFGPPLRFGDRLAALGKRLRDSEVFVGLGFCFLPRIEDLEFVRPSRWRRRNR